MISASSISAASPRDLVDVACGAAVRPARHRRHHQTLGSELQTVSPEKGIVLHGCLQ
jgi:hypothetical protein